jgi:hypothetical protein
MPKPLVIGLPAGEVSRMPGAFPQWSYEPKLVWIVPADESVKIIVRASPERWQVPFVQAVPADGPLVLRELPDWAPPERVYKEFATPVPCINCGTASTRYRAIRGALVCTKCRRSFDHTA